MSAMKGRKKTTRSGDYNLHPEGLNCIEIAQRAMSVAGKCPCDTV